MGTQINILEGKSINRIQLYLLNRKIRKDIIKNHELEYVFKKLRPTMKSITKNELLICKDNLPDCLRKMANSKDKLIIKYMVDRNGKVIAYYLVNLTKERTRFFCDIDWYGDLCKVDLYIKAILEKNIGICGHGIKALMGWR